MKHYLVTGGAGFIGSHLVDTLIKEGNSVIVVDNLSSGKKEHINSKAKFYHADICDFERIKPLFKGIDCVFHLAAIPKVPFSIQDPVGTSQANILGTINIFKASSDAKVKRVIFASSSSVYGDQKKLPFMETMMPNPISPYGLQKLVGEQFAKLFTQLYGIKIICLRYFNVYGPRIDFDSDYSLAVGKFLRLKLQNKPLTIYGNGRQTRSFCYIDDVVNANIKASRSSKVKGGEVINIGHPKSYSINYLAELVGGRTKYFPPRTGDPLHTKADLHLAKHILSWQPKIDLDIGIEATKKWFERNVSDKM